MAMLSNQPDRWPELKTLVHDAGLVEAALNSRRCSQEEMDAALIKGVEDGRLHVVRLLLDHGADVHVDKFGLVRLAASRGDLEVVRLLLDRGANVHAGDDWALHLAASSGHLEVMRLLLEYGADVQGGNNAALWQAAGNGHLEAIRLLLKHGADVHAATDAALCWALRGNQLEAARLLLEHGADVNASDGEVISDLQAINRSHEMESFLKLGPEILECSKSRSPRRALGELIATERRPLKSDAFSKSKIWHEQPMVRAALHAACAAAVVSEGEEVMRRVFRHLAQGDIKRVEGTAGLSWQKYAELLDNNLSQISTFRDVVTEVAETAVFPLLAGPELGKDEVKKLLAEARARAGALIAEGKSTLDFGSLNRRWHRGGNRLPLELRPYRARGSWCPFIEGEFDAGGGWTVAALRSAADLRTEGDVLRHCVGGGGYDLKCQAGEAHVLSVRRDGVPVATVELGVSVRGSVVTPDRRRWEVIQFRGADNVAPEAGAREAWGGFWEKASHEGVKLADRHGRTEESQRLESKLTAVAAVSGYDLKDAGRIIPQVLAHYRKFITVQRGRKAGAVPLLSPESEAWILQRLK